MSEMFLVLETCDGTVDPVIALSEELWCNICSIIQFWAHKFSTMQTLLLSRADKQ